jgi:hypothetical protein
LQVGDIIPDYGGRDETFEVALVETAATLVYRSRRAGMDATWAITLTPLASLVDGGDGGTSSAVTGASGSATRVHLRLRLGPVRRKWLARSVGELFDALTIAGLAVGLGERLEDEI